MDLNFNSFYEYVLTLDEQIRFIGFIDEMGKLMYGGMKPGVTSIEHELESLKIYMDYALINKIHSDVDDVLGKVIYSLTIREKIKILNFPLDNYIIRISLEKKTDHEKIIQSILKYLENNS